jgi:hypothetical protein
VLGTTEHNKKSEALLEIERTDLPPVIKQHCMLVGRTVIEKNSTSGFTDSIFVTTYSGTIVINHNDTSNIQGGTTNEHYHLTEAQHTALGSTYTKAITLGVNDSVIISLGQINLYLTIPYTGTITKWYLSCDVESTIVLDVWKKQGANPTVDDTITGSAKPGIITDTNNNSDILTGWTTAVAAGDVIELVIDQNDNAKTITLVLEVVAS